MKISFVIPAHNEQKLIGKCLTSVFEELNRNDLAAEVIVVNNASTDRTREEALKFAGVTVVDEPLKGLVFARRAGFVVSTGVLVANIDADTMVPKGWLKEVMSAFEEDDKLVALSGPFIYHDISFFERALVRFFYIIGYIFYILVHYVLQVGAMLQGGNYIVRRSALHAIGGYDTSIAFYGEDTDIARRLGKVGEVRWTFALPIYASGRRLRKEGILTMGVRYALNFFWMNFLGRPFTHAYKDIRPE